MKWRACVVVTEAVAKYTSTAVESLVRNGFEGVDLLGPRGITLSDNEFVVRKRCEAGATEAELFSEALACNYRALSKDVEFLLVMRADIELWSSAKLLLENTIESNFVSIYFPHCPKPFFAGVEQHLPCKGMGWCEVKVEEPVSGSYCFVLNKHSMALLSRAAADLVARAKVEPEYGYWPYTLAALIQNLDIPTFAHTPSIARVMGSQEETVPMDQRLNPRFVERNWYLN